MNETKISVRLKKARTNANFTQKEVYEKLGIAQSTYSSWEIGKAEPDADTIGKLCSIFGITPNEFMEWKTEEDNILEPNDFWIIDGEKIYLKDMPKEAQEDLINHLRLIKKAYNLKGR